MLRIYPSLISADLLNLERVIRTFEPYCAGFHLDIMDGHFVPALTFGPAFVNAIAKISTKPLWVHLMVEKPEIMIESLDLPAGSTLSFHIETKSNINNTISRIKEKNWLAGIALSPKTEPSALFPFLGSVDQVLIMSVEPGASGQPFLEGAVAKIEPLAEFREKNGLDFTIAMDGGINEKNLKMLSDAGVQEFAIAAGIFGAQDPLEKLKELTEMK